jgi:hypothetical protein
MKAVGSYETSVSHLPFDTAQYAIRLRYFLEVNLPLLIKFCFTEYTACLRYKSITLVPFREMSFIVRIIRNS